MNKGDVISGIARAWKFAEALKLGEAFSNPAPMRPDEEFRSVALDPERHYEELYLCGLRRGQYNFILNDYSYFQFGIEQDDHVRFAYYPNPFYGATPTAVSELVELRQYVTEGVLEYEEYLHKMSELRQGQHPPLIRYENAPNQYLELRHPCSHLHLGHHSDNRWPVQRLLTPVAFALLIFKGFYPRAWVECGKGTLEGENNKLDDALIAERQNCRVLSDEFFSPREQQTPHFS